MPWEDGFWGCKVLVLLPWLERNPMALQCCVLCCTVQARHYSVVFCAVQSRQSLSVILRDKNLGVSIAASSPKP